MLNKGEFSSHWRKSKTILLIDDRKSTERIRNEMKPDYYGFIQVHVSAYQQSKSKSILFFKVQTKIEIF